VQYEHEFYSNRARGERAKREVESGAPEPAAVEVIDVSEYHPPRIPSKKWRELIKKVWEVDPLICPHCGAEMKLIALCEAFDYVKWQPAPSRFPRVFASYVRDHFT
jgi:hypothetical protein